MTLWLSCIFAGFLLHPLVSGTKETFGISVPVDILKAGSHVRVMKEIVPGIYPPGGWSYQEPDGTPFEASNLPALVQLVWAYRRRNRMEPGNPFREVQEYICKQHPSICREVAEPLQTYAEAAQDKALVQSVITHAGNWLEEKMHGQLKPVTLPIASPRITACAACPARKNWWTQCGSCRENTQMILSAVMSPRQPHQVLEGEACSIFGDDLSVAVFLNEPPTKSNVPAKCWRKTKSPLA